MGIHGRRPAAALVLTLGMSFGLLTACGGSTGDGAGSDRATAPTAGSPTAGPGAPTGSPAGSPLRGKVIAIDPGHNGGNAAHPEVVNKKVDVITVRKACDTTGTQTDAGYPEHAFTWDVSRRLEKLLRERGAKIVLTRDGDKGTGPCITERAAIGNQADADAAVSIHADGAGPRDRGFHIIEPLPIKGHTDRIAEDSHRLGLALRDAYKKGTGLGYSTYRGKKAMDPRDDLGGLNLSKVPKVFIECGNMRNRDEAAKLADAAFRQRIAEALLRGFEDYFA